MSTVFDTFWRDKFGHAASHWRGPKLDSKNIVESQIWPAGVGHLYKYMAPLFVPDQKKIIYLDCCIISA